MSETLLPMLPAARFRKHVLVCAHVRPEGNPRGSCGPCGGEQLRERLLALVKAHGLKGEVRINKTHCLDACELGPVVVVHPNNLWYVGVTLEDLDAIFAASVVGDGVAPERVATAATWRHLQQLRSGA